MDDLKDAMKYVLRAEDMKARKERRTRLMEEYATIVAAQAHQLKTSMLTARYWQRRRGPIRAAIREALEFRKKALHPGSVVNFIISNMAHDRLAMEDQIDAMMIDHTNEFFLRQGQHESGLYVGVDWAKDENDG